MHRFHVLTALLAAGLLPAQDPAKDKPKAEPAPAAAPVLKVGSEVPGSVSLKTTEGRSVSFTDLRGSIVVLHFWSVTCPWEELAEPKINQLTTDFKEQKVVVLAINSNKGEIGDEPAAEQFKAEKEADRPYQRLKAKAKEVAMNHEILVDHSGDVARMFAAKTTPHCYVIDAKGVLRYAGALDDDGQGKKGKDATPHVVNAVKALLEGREPEVAETTPYG
ncbi:MAG: hypothetical protein RIT25_2333 [Planctomycetota bacterium]|jgi:peroxiredoxin